MSFIVFMSLVELSEYVKLVFGVLAEYTKGRNFVIIKFLVHPDQKYFRSIIPRLDGFHLENTTSQATVPLRVISFWLLFQKVWKLLGKDGVKIRLLVLHIIFGCYNAL